MGALEVLDMLASETLVSLAWECVAMPVFT